MRTFTPEQVLAHRFSSARHKGYDTIAVDGYLEQLAEYIGRLHGELALRQTSERSALELLQNARRSADRALLAAALTADQIRQAASAELAEAQAEAGRLLEHAREEAERIAAEARCEARRSLEQNQARIVALDQSAHARQQELQSMVDDLTRFVTESAFDLRSGASRIAEVADQLQFGVTARSDPLDLRGRSVDPL